VAECFLLHSTQSRTRAAKKFVHQGDRSLPRTGREKKKTELSHRHQLADSLTRSELSGLAVPFLGDLLPVRASVLLVIHEDNRGNGAKRQSYTSSTRQDM